MKPDTQQKYCNLHAVSMCLFCKLPGLFGFSYISLSLAHVSLLRWLFSFSVVRINHSGVGYHYFVPCLYMFETDLLLVSYPCEV